MEDVLKALKTNGGVYTSGEDLAAQAGITRAGIWKQVQLLRELGYQIDSSPRKGYRLTGVSSSLIPYEIRDGLATKIIGQVIYYEAQVNSTNQRARELARQGAVEGSLVIAETQTKGRGRLGRSWESTPGKGLWLSLILRPKINSAALAGITLITAVAMAQAIDQETGIQVEIKWPNDLVYQGRKLAGILAEISGEMDLINYLVIGIGLNVAQSASDFPAELQEKATSLFLEGQRVWERRLILQRFLGNFEAAYLNLASLGLKAAVSYTTAHSATLGRKITVKQGVNSLTGVAVELDWDGSLWLQLADGKLNKVFSGDIIEH